MQVLRIKEMAIKGELSWRLNTFSKLVSNTVYED